MGRIVRYKQGSERGKSQHPAKRSWTVSMAFSVAVVGASILVSATVNPLFGRAVHWNWMAVLAPTLFATMTVVLRNRWA